MLRNTHPEDPGTSEQLPRFPYNLFHTLTPVMQGVLRVQPDQPPESDKAGALLARWTLQVRLLPQVLSSRHYWQ